MSEGLKKVSIAIEIDREEMMALAVKIGGNSGSWEERCGRFARAIGCGFSRAKALMYGEARRIDSHELETARRLAAVAEQRAKEARIHADINEMRARLLRLEELIANERAALVGERGGRVREALDAAR